MRQKAIIVGATSGIGKEVCKQLSQKGWELAIVGRRLNILQQMQQEDEHITAIKEIDITQEDAPQKLLELMSEMGPVDLYFHSSGVGFQNPGLSFEKEISTVQTNVLGFTQMVDTVFNYYVGHPNEKGQIAVISSIAGTKGLGAAPAYSSTKRYINHYLECLTQLTHIRKIQNITITDIRPGFVKTPLLDQEGSYPLQLSVEEAAKSIIKGVLKKKSIVTVDWKYKILVFFWKLIPRWLWVRLPIATK